MGLVRLFLALVVASAHFQMMITRPNHLPTAPEIFSLGFHSAYAVMFFYVISGFLITFTLTENYANRPGGALLFYKNRAIRIFSLYWPVLLFVFLFIPGAADAFRSGSGLDKFTGVFLLGADWNLDFALYPNDNWNALPTALHPAWTLGAETTFYILAPLLVRRFPLVLALFFLSLLLRTTLVMILGTHLVERWMYYFAPSTFLFFLAGQGICMISRERRSLQNPVLGCGLMLIAFLTMILTHDTGFDIPRLWISVAFFTAGLPGFFQATKNIKWMNAVGNLSYPVYLTHEIVVLLLGPDIYYFFVRHDLASSDDLTIIISSFLVVSVAVGAVTNVVVERPLSSAVKALLRHRPVPTRRAAS